MMTDDHFQEIYTNQAEKYDAMVSREDYQAQILPALAAIMTLDGLNVLEMGAGTGRLTRLLAPHVNGITALDISPQMLRVAKQSFSEQSVRFSVSDNQRLAVKSDYADLVIAGWSFGHATGWHKEQWQQIIGDMLNEMMRVARPGGTIIILETMGTGTEQPTPPNTELAAYYAWLQNEQGFDYRWIRTDYQFESVGEAEELMRFFFGDELADRIVAEQLFIVPECTGIWWKQV